MSRYKNGNPKKKSRFICCKCLQENMIGTGIQREHKQREKNHVKDLYCLEDKEVTKNLEVRYCDIFEEMMDKASELHIEYYGEKVKGGVR
jgi:chromatin remodeling complex protein RSC6